MNSTRAAMIVAPLMMLASGGVSAQGQISGNAFNPAVSLILNGSYTSYSRNPKDYAIPGFALADEAGLAAEGLSIDETELTLSANIDDKFYGFATVAFEQDAGETETEVEEIYFETLALPNGLKVKAGKFLSEIGYLNASHPHAWDFADAPLAYTAMLGSTYGDTGVQLRWVAPVALYLEIGAELMRGDAFPAAGGAAAGGNGAHTFAVHVGGDVGSSHRWRAGVSSLSAEAHDRESAFDSATLGFTGDSDLTIVDFVWKWARNGNPRDRYLIAQAEFLHRSENGSLSLEDTLDPMQTGTYDGDQDGWYVQGVYQFRPRWRVGLRLDRLSSSNAVQDITTPLPLDATHDPSRLSAMVDFSNSEFSRLRLQWNRDESLPETDDQIYLQYIMSLGAHGAHRF
jgi:hypothetical protein